jgi:DNA-binding response OmpR family regulator
MPSPHPRVLLVHDDELMCEFLVDVLEPHGYAVHASPSGAGLSRLAAGDIDLVVLDLGWPEADGLDLCMRLRGAPTTKHVPVVALTDFPAETRDVLAFGLGPDDYLTKPFVLDELLSVVASYRVPGVVPATPR